MPSLQNIDSSYTVDQNTATIMFSNVTLSTYGSIYMIVQDVAQIVQDPQDEFSTTNIPTRYPRTPTAQQIYNCTDWSNQAVKGCVRGVYANNGSLQILVTGVPTETEYVVYYVIANEYPIQAVFDAQVSSMTVSVLNFGKIVKLCGWMLLVNIVYF